MKSKVAQLPFPAALLQMSSVFSNESGYPIDHSRVTYMQNTFPFSTDEKILIRRENILLLFTYLGALLVSVESNC